MTEKVEFTEPHSTLEVANRISIVSGLELDQATNAPELDKAAYAPQVAFDQEQNILINHSLPEVVKQLDDGLPEAIKQLDDGLPEVIKQLDDGLQAVDESEGSHKRHLFGLSRKVEILILIILIVTVLVAVGVGTGVGVTNKNTPSSSMPTSISTQTSASRYIHQDYISTPPKLISSSTSSPSSQPSVVSASSHLILNDSSLSALTLTGDDRIVLFQDQTGIIRQIRYHTFNKTWSMTPSPIVASGPKNFTPLALLHNPSTTNDAIHLFYIATSNNLAFVVYDTFNGSWSNHTELVNSRGLPFSAATNSRTLLAKRLGNSTPSLLQVLIHYENADGNVTILEGLNTPPSGAWTMQDITSKLESSLRPQGILRAPCSSMRYGNAVRFISTEQTSANMSEKSMAVTADYEDEKFNSTSEENMFDSAAIGGSDVQLALNGHQIYGLWVNGTRLASFNTVSSSPNLQTIPDSLFPYVRLAGINPNPGYMYYLYNQISPDTFVQNQWNHNEDIWTPSKIKITEIQQDEWS